MSPTPKENILQNQNRNENLKSTSWENPTKLKSTKGEKSTNARVAEKVLQEINISATKPVGGEGGGGVSSLSPTPKEIILQKILQNMKTKPFLPPPRHEVQIIPSWSGMRRKRQFLRKMDRVYWNIIELENIEEEKPTENCDTNTQEYKSEKIYRIDIDKIPPPP